MVLWEKEFKIAHEIGHQERKERAEQQLEGIYKLRSMMENLETRTKPSFVGVNYKFDL